MAREGRAVSDYHSAVPDLRAFRALRYAHAPASDISTVLCPPYDIIGPDRLATLLERDPHNAVRLELPQPVSGMAPDSRYQDAARTLAAWRADRVLVMDWAPTVTLHEMCFRGPSGGERRALGVFVRLGLEPFGAGVRRHERTLTGPKEDRLALLRATATNLSPVVLLHDADRTRTRALLDDLTGGIPDSVATTDDGVRHRVWIADATAGRGADDDARPIADETAASVAELLRLIGGSPLTIADGHHRYETALRYREERRGGDADVVDPAWDSVLALLYHVDDAPPVLPTHRVLLRGPAGDDLLGAWSDLFGVERLEDAGAVMARMASPAPGVDDDATGTGRVGFVSGGVSAVLTARAEAFVPLLDAAASDASRGLDVNRVAVALERIGVDGPALAAGDRVRYVKSAAEAVALAADGGAAAALLLDGPPVSAVTRVAAADEVMPQKSTYFDPKAPTGLLFGPLEW